MSKEIDNQLLRGKNESIAEYCHRISSTKDIYGLTWENVAYILNSSLNLNFSADKYRKQEYAYMNRQDPADTELINEQILSMKMERTKLADERSQVNALYRRIAREDSIKEIASEVAAKMGGKLLIPAPKKAKASTEKEAVLEVSDWHYGIEIENAWNVYNPDVAKERISFLKEETRRLCLKEEVSTLHIVNLGDLIAGRIHTQLRINSRFDVITQIIEVSELLAEMIADLGKDFTIHYYDTLDNHSRLEPNLKESLDLESLTRITTWYLKERLSGKNVIIHDNKFADDIITFECLGHEIIGVHGHRDKLSKVIDNLTTMTKRHYDLCLTAHLHHFSAEEKNETVLISNSSLMGTDDFAEKLRLSAIPSQNLIIVTKENPVYCLYKINVD